jgi:pilus assembly protein Flp/PilA
MKFVKKFWRDEEGQDLVEYALLAALMALIAVAAFPPVGNSIKNVFSKVIVQLERTS